MIISPQKYRNFGSKLNLFARNDVILGLLKKKYCFIVCYDPHKVYNIRITFVIPNKIFFKNVLF